MHRPAPIQSACEVIVVIIFCTWYMYDDIKLTNHALLKFKYTFDRTPYIGSPNECGYRCGNKLNIKQTLQNSKTNKTLCHILFKNKYNT